jgi:isopentenyl-diphosphate delta-isomerase
MSKQTESRKNEHVELVIKEGAQYGKPTGFEHVDLIHNSLPEISLEDVDLSTEFMGRKIKYPMLITGMTGGYEDALAINRALAEIAQKYGLAFGLGSQRAMIESPGLARTYAVRDVAPDIPILGNIGAYQLKKYKFSQIESMVSSVEADALAIHLNPLQEVIQKEGDTDYSGVVDAISKTCEKLDVPVIVKETGAGMSQDVALKLKEAGASWLDIAGAGGTSWSRVEYLRNGAVPGFEEWGIPTLESLVVCRGVLPIVASGGLRNGVDAAKAIALGATMAGAAYPFIMALREARIEEFVTTFTSQMKIAAYLTGSKNLLELKKAKTMFH